MALRRTWKYGMKCAGMMKCYGYRNSADSGASAPALGYLGLKQVIIWPPTSKKYGRYREAANDTSSALQYPLLFAIFDLVELEPKADRLRHSASTGSEIKGTYNSLICKKIPGMVSSTRIAISYLCGSTLNAELKVVPYISLNFRLRFTF